MGADLRSFAYLSAMCLIAVSIGCSKAEKSSANSIARNGGYRPGCQFEVPPKPMPLMVVRAEYTELARYEKIEGTVFVEVNIDETGKVTNAKVVRGLNPDYGLHKACITAAYQCTYVPGFREGVPVKSVLTYAVTFKLKEQRGTPKG